MEKTQLLTLFIVKLAFSESVISKLYAMIIIVIKHTPECTKLHYFEKNYPGSMLPNPSSDIPQRDVFQHFLFSKIIPMFEHGFRSLMYICFKANQVYYY